MRPSNPQMLILGNPGKKRAPFHYPKGSPEAREYMARLRAMRGKKNPLTDREASSQMHRGSLTMKIGQKYHAQGMDAHAIHAAAHAQGLYEGVEVTAKSPFMRRQASDQAAASYQSAGEWWPKGGYHLTGRTGNPSVGSDIWSDENKLLSTFQWLTRNGMGRHFGNMPIGWYQQHQTKAIDFILRNCMSFGCDPRSVRVVNGWVQGKDVTGTWRDMVRTEKVFEEADKGARGGNPSSPFHRKTNPRRKKLGDFPRVVSRGLPEVDPVCDYCGTDELVYMGQMGRGTHAYRCRRCGMDKVTREENPLTRFESAKILREARQHGRLSGYYSKGIAKGLARAVEIAGPRRALRAAGIVGMRAAGFGPEEYRKYYPPRRSNPAMRGIPSWMANDPNFRQELAAYTKRHGRGPVKITQVNVPAGYPKYMSVYGKAPEIKYDAPSHSNKGKRIHKFGEGGGRPPWLATSASRGPKFLSFVGGTFKAKDWIYK